MRNLNFKEGEVPCCLLVDTRQHQLIAAAADESWDVFTLIAQPLRTPLNKKRRVKFDAEIDNNKEFCGLTKKKPSRIWLEYQIRISVSIVR